MRNLPSKALFSSLALTLIHCPALADHQGYPHSHSYTNQTGIHMPPMPQNQGQDEVRSSSGLSCRSSNATSGPVMDMGVIGSGTNFAEGPNSSLYARVVIPLGERPTRLDCNALYQLELERLRLEVEMLRMGLGQQATR